MHAPQSETPRTSFLFRIPSPREGLFLGLALALLSSLPYFAAAYPMLTDYPAHLASYYVMLDAGRNPYLARYYEFQWLWTGNLGADILIWPLAKLFGLERAGWLIGLIIPPLTGFGIVAVEWVLRRRVGVASLLAMALIWSPAMVMGFYNFCLSLALALLSFALWVRLQDWRWRGVLFLPLGMVVWLCHVAGWGVLGVLVFGYEWQREKGVRAFLAPWPLALPFIPMLLNRAAPIAQIYGENVERYKIGIWIQAMRDQAVLLDLGSPLLILLILLATTILWRIDGRLGWAALILGGLTIVMPRHLGGGDYADLRLIAVALMIGCLAISWQVPRWVLWLAPLLFLVRLDATVDGWHRQSRELDGIMKALDHIPRGARVAGAVLVESRRWETNSFQHVPSYVTVRRDALVNSHFAIPGVHMLHVKEGGRDFVDPSHRIMHSPGQAIDLAAFKPAKQADYLWYIGRLPPTRMPEGATVLYRTKGSFLARLANPTGPR